MLKRGLSATIEEWLMAAEYIMHAGNPNVILCERGIRTFETATRNTLDLSAIPLIKRLSHLPIIADPSHGTGNRYLVQPMALAAAAAGADGLIIEVHPQPETALSDGPQSLTLEGFEQLMATLEQVLAAVGRPLARPRSIVSSERLAGSHGVTSLLTATDRIVEPARARPRQLRVPGDKSISHRAALFNALGEGQRHDHQLLAGADCGSSARLSARPRRGDRARRRIGSSCTVAGLRGLAEADRRARLRQLGHDACAC